MEWIESLISNNFDFSFIILIILGNFYIYNLSFYPKSLLAWKKSKTFLTALHSLLLGVIYYFILNYFANETLNFKVLLNSFFLSTSLYEFGVKDALEYLKDNGSGLLLKTIKKRVEDDESKG
jgi:hypothetical protein